MLAKRQLPSPLSDIARIISFLVLFQLVIFASGKAVQTVSLALPIFSDFLVNTPLVWDASTTLRVAASLIVALLIVQVSFRKSLWSRADWLPVHGKRFTRYLVLGLVLQTVFTAMVHTERLPLVVHNIGSLRGSPNGTFWLFTVGLLVLQLVATGIEEIVWRGVTLKALLQVSNSPKLAIGLTSVLFGLWHLFGSTSVTKLPYLTMLGLVIGIVYFWKRSLYAAWGTHFGINIAAEVWTGNWSEAVTGTSASDETRLDMYLLGLLSFVIASWILNRQYKSQQATAYDSDIPRKTFI